MPLPDAEKHLYHGANATGAALDAVGASVDVRNACHSHC